MSYQRPETVGSALEALASGASPIAGGTDWYPAHGDGPMPDTLLDLTALPGFRGITRHEAGWRIGAATTWTDILRTDLPPAFDGLRAASREVGSVQIQTVATIGGNLCNASPAADGMPPLLCLDAQVEIVGPAGLQTMPLAAFVTGVRQTALEPGALLQAIHIPDPGEGSRSSFVKLGARKYLVISIAMVSALLRIDAGRIIEARVAVGACSAVACRMPSLEALLIGSTTDDMDRAVTPDSLAGLAPIGDIRGEAEYRAEVAAELIRRALRIAAMEPDHG